MCCSDVHPDRDEPIDWALIHRYFIGAASADEAEQVRQRLQDPAFRAALDAAFRVGMPPAVADRDWKTGAALGRLTAEIRKSQRRPVLAALRDRARTTGSPWTRLAVAAGLLLATALGVALHAHRPREYATGIAQRLTVTLDDGSAFTLAPASRLRVPLSFAIGDRTVDLVEGEAYFAIVHDVRHPFTVRAGQTRTVDVGTAFDVRAYASDTNVRVTVAEGRVDVVASTEAPTRVVAGQAVVVDPAHHVSAPQLVDASTLVAWREGRLAHHDAPASMVIADLARWYDLDIALAPALARQRLTADWTNVGTDRLVAELAALLNARVEHHGNRVVLTALGAH